ncbi:MAG: SIMPL domain-containing protein [Paludibacteraceae bacterium]|nr:SIMPL domain-containing protein [Paludibacteraceae bacterium]
MKNNQFMAAAVIGLGLVLSAWILSGGLTKIAFKDRSVTVKGLATADVKADYAVFPIDYKVLSNDLVALQNESDRVMKVIKATLIAKGFEANDISEGKVTVNDQWTDYYSERRPEMHYSLEASIVVSTEKVDLVAENLNLTSELLSKGIIVSINQWSIDYQYNGLSDLKPQMIEEATRNARAVAKKFAEDSKSKLGGIRRANQGQFSVESDEYQPWIKHVRVVTTVDYFLN